MTRFDSFKLHNSEGKKIATHEFSNNLLHYAMNINLNL